MKLFNPSAEVFVPDGVEEADALSRTTHIGIGAHQDDLEFMTIHGILECFGQPDKWYTGVVVTDGAGSPRAGLYSRYTDDDMRRIRRLEQRKAAIVGEYASQFLMDYTSSQVKDAGCDSVVEDLVAVLTATRPEVVYTHNLADKHDTHISVALRTIEAIRRLPEECRPSKIFGCEAWRSLDWLCDDEKILHDVAEHEALSEALMGVFDSQISGGKRYDIASIGRRRANATYLASHHTDTSTAFMYAMDMTPLLDPSVDVAKFALGFIERLSDDVRSRVTRLSAR